MTLLALLEVSWTGSEWGSAGYDAHKSAWQLVASIMVGPWQYIQERTTRGSLDPSEPGTVPGMTTSLVPYVFEPRKGAAGRAGGLRALGVRGVMSVRTAPQQ